MRGIDVTQKKLKVGVLVLAIREAEEKDLEQILELYTLLEADKSHGININAAKDILKKIKSYPDYAIYVDDLDGKVVGTFALAIMDNIAHMGARSGLVEDIVVSEAYRRKGIGKRMITSAMDICRQKGCYKIALSSNIKRDDAHKFYESLGFKIHGYSFIVEL